MALDGSEAIEDEELPLSMAQREVGRSRTAHEASAVKGEGERLESLLPKVKPERLAAIRAGARLSL